MYKTNSTLLLISGLLLLASSFSHAEESQQCESAERLKGLSGHYAREDIWERLPVEKNWARTTRLGWPTAVDIDYEGQAIGSLGWHEGESVCVHRVSGKEIWVRFYPPSNLPGPVGPFVRVGATNTAPVLYFDHLFGTKCYTSNAGPQWCFGSGNITVGTEKHGAELVLDVSGMPTYGTPVAIDGEDEFWVFVPYGEGWKVFLDTYPTEEDHKEIDPTIAEPWAVLKAK